MRVWKVSFLLTLVLGWPLSASAEIEGVAQQANTAPAVSDGICSVRPQDEVWLISTRHLGCPFQKPPAQPDFQVYRFAQNGSWQLSDWNVWQQDGHPQAITVVYVHGNRTDGAEVFDSGWDAYRRLVSDAESSEPIRFVIWSWPSTQIRGPLRDVRAKAARADYETVYLAQFLDTLPAEHRVGLFGFSYGSRIITGALHLRGGGTLCGYRLPETASPVPRTARVVLWGAAEANCWLLPGAAHGECLTPVDRLLVQFNSCDRVLRLYKRMDHRNHTPALGSTGLPCVAALGENAARLDQQDVCCPVGREHHLEGYLSSAAVMSELRRYVLWQPL